MLRYSSLRRSSLALKRPRKRCISTRQSNGCFATGLSSASGPVEPHPCHKRDFEASYNPATVESGVREWWEITRNVQTPKRDTGKRFSMVLPPPNVTGQLHIGHALTVAIQDAMIRFRSMCGDRVLWVPGADHAGIATQAVVERKLAKQGISRSSLGRQKFIDEVLRWCDIYGGRINDQLRELGASLDWDHFTFTQDSKSSQAVNWSFVELHRRGLIYRANRMVNWCPHLGTVVSTLEVKHIELAGPTWLKLPGRKEKIEFGVAHDFAYRVIDSSGQPSEQEVVVRTTRIETMLGDTGVAVHADDPRYTALHGCSLVHPFFPERQIPIVLDNDLVDMESGTGAVKITPAHDLNDFNCGKRHGLKQITIFNNDGSINDTCGPEWNGKDRFAVRKELVDRLKGMGLYRGKHAHPMSLSSCSSSGDILEPMLKPQWFLRCDDMARRSLDFAKTGQLNITPKFHEKTWLHFLENIEDWCLSRQLWWGHQIPAYRVVFLGEEKHQTSDSFVENFEEKWIVAKDEKEAFNQATTKFGLKNGTFRLEQDEDVLDTWFSSAIYPFTALGWHGGPMKSAAYPLSLMETGADILFFWVARMVMLCSELYDDRKCFPPFPKVFLHPIIRDRNGRKMSKSLGNVLDPMHVIKGASLATLEAEILNGNLDQGEVSTAIKGMKSEYPDGVPECGTDALRLALASCLYDGATTINVDVNRLVYWRQFGNKLWNAHRYVSMKITSAVPERILEITNGMPTTLEARWIMSKLARFVVAYNAAISSLRLDVATSLCQEFVVSQFCDVYIEASKHILNDNLDENRGQYTENLSALVECMDTTLRLMHPLAPFVTEELWHRLLSTNNVKRVPSCGLGTLSSRQEYKPNELLCMQAFPLPDEYKKYIDEEAEKEMGLVMDCVRATRSLQEKVKNVLDRDSRRSRIVIVQTSDEADNLVRSLESAVSTIKSIANVDVVEFVSADDMVTLQDSSKSLESVIRAGILVRLPVNINSGDIDRIKDEANATKQRLIKQKKAITKLEATLKSEEFVAKAPQNVQESTIQKLKDSKAKVESLNATLEIMRHLLKD